MKQASQRIQAVIPQNLGDRLAEHSKKTGLTISKVVLFAVMEYLDNRDKEIAFVKYQQRINEILTDE